MATNLWEQEIDKSVDWGGDASTNNLPVSGKYVQKFIKDTLNSKVGYIKYVKADGKYYAFANADDYNTWSTNHAAYTSLVIGSWDAPKPASFDPLNITSDLTATVLKGEDITASFNYMIKDSNSQVVPEKVTAVVTVTSSTHTKTYTTTYDPSYSLVEVNEKLSSDLFVEGVNTVTISLTGATTGISTILTFTYTIVQLVLSNTGFGTYDGMSGTDSSKDCIPTPISSDEEYFSIPIQVKGTGEKYVELYIDGKKFYQTWALTDNNDEQAYSFDDIIGTSSSVTETINIYTKKNGESLKWSDVDEQYAGDDSLVFGPGKHSFQDSVYVKNTLGEHIYSQTQYFNFVVEDPDSSATNTQTYLIYHTAFNAGTVFGSDDVLEVSGTQYETMSTELTVGVYDSSERKVSVSYDIYPKSEYDALVADPTYNATKYFSQEASSLSEGVIYISHNFTSYGQFVCVISNPYSDDKIIINMNIAQSSAVTAESQTSNIILKLSALNRNNSETEKDVWRYDKGTTHAVAVFNKVLWNDLSGWNDNALVLNNGATVKIPFSIFPTNGTDRGNGTTFEIEFETSDVKDDDAVIMQYDDPSNNSKIVITATSATMMTNTGTSITTNFKDNQKIKIAFVYNPLVTPKDGVYDRSTYTNPNTLMIIVNGVLDRVINTSITSTAQYAWTKPQGSNSASFTIGNTTNEATVKIYNIRVYGTALTEEEEYQNYLYDTLDNKVTLYNKNDVLEDGAVSYEKVKASIPTMLMQVDWTNINSADQGKKGNLPANVVFTDPTDPTRNWMGKNVYFSDQGTSSMMYPQKNLRLYFNKKLGTGRTDVFGNQGTYESELWMSWNMTDDMTIDFSSPESITTSNPYPLPCACNSKIDKKGLHRAGGGIIPSASAAMCQAIAKSWEEQGEDLLDATGNVIKYSDDNAKYYISAYRSILGVGEELGDKDKKTKATASYWTRIRRMRYSGIKLYTRYAAYSDMDNIEGLLEPSVDPDNDVRIGRWYYTQVSKKAALDQYTEYYNFGGCWSETEDDEHTAGYTDTWTIKTDYAESSMAHNSGIARLWGRAMKGVQVPAGELKANYTSSIDLGDKKIESCFNGSDYPCRTGAQAAAAEGMASDAIIDIRTSCDGKPICIFYQDVSAINTETGEYEYGPITFAGLYNIMTDKKSVGLFGFKTIYNENGKKIFDNQSKTECWEYLLNNNDVAMGDILSWDLDTDEVDLKDAIGAKVGDSDSGGRNCFSSFESRWPEGGAEYYEDFGTVKFPDEVYGCPTHHLESFFQWLYFCKDAIVYSVDGQDGYNFQPYKEVSIDEAKTIYENYKSVYKSYADGVAGITDDSCNVAGLYLKIVNAGQTNYIRIPDYDDGEYSEVQTADDGSSLEFNENADVTYYRYNDDVDAENVEKSENTEKIGKHIYPGWFSSFDATYRFIDADGLVDEDKAADFKVRTWVTKDTEGELANKYVYTNNYGNKVQYTDSVDPDGYLINPATGASWKDSTKMDFFKYTKYAFLDVYKVAAYFVYLMRFCAVDQVVKNQMQTTEDGQHWYFINYDNDTTLGVRNNGFLEFSWDTTRETLLSGTTTYAYDGAKSVLWNNLECDSDFMEIVKKIDSAMFTGSLLDKTTVLDYLDNKQVGTWCERLYNEQEETKYVGGFLEGRIPDSKYLKFMHGTRKSHRNWFVNHRWDLFDAQWKSGQYNSASLTFYYDFSDASPSNAIELLRIKAASKHYFSLAKNNGSMELGFYEIDPKKQYESPYANTDTTCLKEADPETGIINEVQIGERSWWATENIGVGSPMKMYGMPKILELNIRPSVDKLSPKTAFSMLDAYTVTKYDENNKPYLETTNWIASGGCMMTKLLFGDGVKECQITDISNLNNVTSLEEIDIRKLVQITTLDISSLNNLHRFRADGSTLTTFSPAPGVSLYETSLPSTIIEMSLNKVSFEDGGEIEDTTVNYTDPVLYTSVDDEVKADSSLLGKVKYNTPEEVVKYTPNSIFKYEPTADLQTIRFESITGFDSWQFIKDWYNVLKNTENVDISGYKIYITDVDWKGVKLEELEEIRSAFNFTMLSGTIEVLGTGTDEGGLSYEEYIRIKENPYFGDGVFKTTNALVFNCKTGMFTEVEGLTSKTAVENDETGLTEGTSYYTSVRGKSITISSSVFPADADRKLLYVLRYKSGTGANDWSTASFDQETMTFTVQGAGITLQTTTDDYGILKTEENSSINPTLMVYVYKYVANGSSFNSTSENNLTIKLGKEPLYFLMAAQQVPTSVTSVTTDDTVVENKVYDENVHHCSIKFNNHDKMNVDVKSLLVSLSSTGRVLTNSIAEISNVTIDNTTHSYEFDVKYTIQNLTTSCPIYITATFDVENATSRQVKYEYTNSVVTIPATSLYITYGDPTTWSNEKDSDTKNIINATGDYVYNIHYLPENYNLAITSVDTVVDSMDAQKLGVGTAEDTINTMKLTVADNKVSGVYKSFAEESPIIVTATRKDGQTITTKFNCRAAVIYPEIVEVTHYDISATSSGYAHTDLQLTDNKGTYADASNTTANIIEVSGDDVTTDGIFYKLNVLAGTSALRDETDPWNTSTVTQPFEVTDVNVDVSIPNNVDNVDPGITVKLVNYSEKDNAKGKSGISGFYVKVKCMSGMTLTTQLHITGTVNFENADTIKDNTEGVSIDGEKKTLTIDKTIEIGRSVAYATTWKEITSSDANKLFIVDNKGRFFTRTFKSDGSIDITSDSWYKAFKGDSSNAVGIAWYAGENQSTALKSKAVICVALQDIVEDNTYLFPWAESGADKSLALQAVYITSAYSEYRGTGSGTKWFGSLEEASLDITRGSSFTKFAMENTATNEPKSAAYKCYNYLKGTLSTGMYGYLPGYEEMMSVLGSNGSNYDTVRVKEIDKYIDSLYYEHDGKYYLDSSYKTLVGDVNNILFNIYEKAVNPIDEIGNSITGYNSWWLYLCANGTSDTMLDSKYYYGATFQYAETTEETYYVKAKTDSTSAYKRVRPFIQLI